MKRGDYLRIDPDAELKQLRAEVELLQDDARALRGEVERLTALNVGRLKALDACAIDVDRLREDNRILREQCRKHGNGTVSVELLQIERDTADRLRAELTEFRNATADELTAKNAEIERLRIDLELWQDAAEHLR